MTKKRFKDYSPEQPVLFPTYINDWLPKDHPVHFISEVVEKLDLSEIYDDYRESRGQPPYEPLMMVKVLVYAMYKGIHSSRKIEQALYEDVAFRLLSANQQPDHWTISEFRRRHHKAMGNLFDQTVKLALDAGLVKLEHVSVDGTKIKANASKHSAMSYTYMQKEEGRLREEIEKILNRMEEIDRAEDKIYGDRVPHRLPAELATKEKRLKAIEEAKKRLEERARERVFKEQEKRKQKAQKEGKTYKPRKNPQKARPKPKEQENFTDPESRIMVNSDKAFIQGYNAQASVDALTHVIVAARLTNQPGDRELLKEQIEQVKETTGRCPKEVSADAGYYSEENLEYLEDEHIEAFIPPDKVKHSTCRSQIYPRGRIPKDADRKYLMRRKLKTKRGRERYKLRQTSVEPVFGNIKEQFKLRQFLLRGLEKTNSIWRFACAVHNILKLYRAGTSLKTGLVMG